jgi:hypothetical protein
MPGPSLPRLDHSNYIVYIIICIVYNSCIKLIKDSVEGMSPHILLGP